ncbi:hypothetical protein BRETT_005237 [Brettanomyces bruxellensis]|uniref:Uncharacterized protein n=1 Tax=Dekkera bruxellensis TaxID=5007 RepID=A0A871R257_DEKBR|nr:uncharacterized protein BRETT_005237 [Brettanomyces bruxellensis]QOU18175.1 hypothetical protein BRETT_005237 [Brettanomyces bruxellensis]
MFSFIAKTAGCAPKAGGMLSKFATRGLKRPEIMGMRQLTFKNGFHTRPTFTNSAFWDHGHTGSVAQTMSFRNAQNSNLGTTGLLLGIMGLSATYLIHHNPILNDSANIYSVEGLPPAPKGYEYVKVPEKPKFDKLFGGRLNYKELTLGSMFGLISGLIVGQLSTVFVFIALGAYLAAQYLHAQGILTVPVTKIIKVGSEDIDVRQMVFDQPSFSITYILSFLIAAYNV